MSKPFWKEKTLAQMSREEWESLCDGCAKCCLVKLQDEDSDEVVYTDVACRYLDRESCQCLDYSKRLNLAEDCIQLKAEDVKSFHWLPVTCAYRLVSEGRNLPQWHYLRCGDRSLVHKAGVSVQGRCISQDDIAEEELEERVVFWVE